MALKNLLFFCLLCVFSFTYSQNVHYNIWYANYEQGYSDGYRSVAGRRPQSIPAPTRTPTDREVVDRKLAYRRGFAAGESDAQVDFGKKSRSNSNDSELPTAYPGGRSLGEIQAEDDWRAGEAIVGIMKEMKRLPYRFSIGVLFNANSDADTFYGATFRIPFNILSLEGMYYKNLNGVYEKSLASGFLNFHFTSNQIFVVTAGAGYEYNLKTERHPIDSYFSKNGHFLTKFGFEQIFGKSPIGMQFNVMTNFDMFTGNVSLNYLIR